MKRTPEKVPDVVLNVVNDVLVGLNDELFLAGGAHGVLDVATGKKSLSEDSKATFLKNMKTRRAYSVDSGAQFLQIVAPEKYIVYPEAFPLQAPKSLYDYVRQHAPRWSWYPSRELKDNPYGRSYYPNDTHWTPYGIARVVDGIAKQAGIDDSTRRNVMRSICERITVATPNGVGDLGSKLEPRRTSTWYKFTPSASTRTVENGIVHKGGANAANINDGRLFCSENPKAASSKQILIFGDSYLYDGVAMLAEFFRRVVLCRSRHFHQELVDMMKPDIVVGEMAERYLTRVSDDAKAMPFFLLPYALGRQPEITDEAARFIGRFFSYGREPDYSIYAPPGAAAKPLASALQASETPTIAIDFAKGASQPIEQGSSGSVPHQGVIENGTLVLAANESARVSQAMKAVPGTMYRVEYDAVVVRPSSNNAPLNFFVGPLFLDAAGKVLHWWQEQQFADGERSKKAVIVQATAPQGAAFVFLGWSGPRAQENKAASNGAVGFSASKLAKSVIA